MDSFWNAPSCNNFLHNIANDLWAGNIVLVYLPKHTPPNFKSALKQVMAKNQSLGFDLISLANLNPSAFKPIESLIYNHYELDQKTESHIDKTVHTIFSIIPHEINKLIIIEDVLSESSSLFTKFLIDLSKHNLSIPPIKRHKILVILDPSRTVNDQIPLEPGISKHFYRDLLTELDLSLSLHFYLRIDITPLSSLNESILVALSRFDFQLFELLSYSKNLLQDYFKLLHDYSSQKEWHAIPFVPLDKLTEADYWLRWSLGILDFDNDIPQYSPAYLAQHDKIKQLNSIIWLAIFKVLTPLIEQARILILESPKIVLPFKFQKTSGELKEDKYEFEIGDIYRMYCQHQITFKQISSTERHEIFNFISLCRSLRNDLSHLKIPELTQVENLYKKLPSIAAILRL